MLVHGAFHAGLAQMIIAQGYQFAQSLVALAGGGQVRDLQQPVGSLAHRGDHYHRPAFQPGFDDSDDPFDSFGGFHRGPAEFHDDHVRQAFESAAGSSAGSTPRGSLVSVFINPTIPPNTSTRH